MLIFLLEQIQSQPQFSVIFKPGLLPRNSQDRRFLSASIAQESYILPSHIDRRPELLTTNNQKNTSECGGFAMAGWLEYYRWKYYGIAEQINPHLIYKEAKKLDGSPQTPGTTLEAVLQAAQNLNLISDIDTNSIREISNPIEVKQALHRYGVVLSAFNITDKWIYAQSNGWIPEGGRLIGGHAVITCGYSDVEKPNYFSIQNSWGANQGYNGFNRMTVEQFNDCFIYGLIWDFKK